MRLSCLALIALITLACDPSAAPPPSADTVRLPPPPPDTVTIRLPAPPPDTVIVRVPTPPPPPDTVTVTIRLPAPPPDTVRLPAPPPDTVTVTVAGPATMTYWRPVIIDGVVRYQYATEAGTKPPNVPLPTSRVDTVTLVRVDTVGKPLPLGTYTYRGGDTLRASVVDPIVVTPFGPVEPVVRSDTACAVVLVPQPAPYPFVCVQYSIRPPYRVVTTRDTIYMNAGDTLQLQYGDTIIIPVRVQPPSGTTRYLFWEPAPGPDSIRFRWIESTGKQPAAIAYPTRPPMPEDSVHTVQRTPYMMDVFKGFRIIGTVGESGGRWSAWRQYYNHASPDSVHVDNVSYPSREAAIAALTVPYTGPVYPPPIMPELPRVYLDTRMPPTPQPPEDRAP